MYKKFSLAFLLIFIFGSSYYKIVTAQTASNLHNSNLKIKIDFDITSIEKLILYPEDVLKNEDEFWKTDEAYILLTSWANNNKITLKRDDWRNNVKDLSSAAVSERKNNKVLITATELLNAKDKFIEKAVPHILSYLPQSVPECSTKIYFTVETPGTGFMTNSKIVLNLGAQRFKNDVGYMQNLMLHEVYHIGYGYNRSNRLEYDLENNSLYNILDALQNEGMATYTSYKALDIYPTDNEDDFKLLEDSDKVNSLLHDLNEFFEKADKMNPDDLQNEGWNIGVVKRGYYIVGAFIANTIEEKLGRNLLLNSIEQGPRSFVSVYNSIADNDLKLYEFKMPDKISAWQQLVHAYKNKDTDIIDSLEKEVIKKKNGNEVSFNSLGYFLIRKNRIEDAIRVFKLNTDLFPESANAFDSLAESYMIAGEKELAIQNYEKTLELNPNSDNAKNMIKRLRND